MLHYAIGELLPAAKQWHNMELAYTELLSRGCFMVYITIVIALYGIERLQYCLTLLLEGCWR